MGCIMGKNKTLFLIVVLLLSCACCFAKQVSFQIVQHDDRSEKVSEQSYVVEDKLLDEFFNYGFIVTNSAAAVSNSEAQDEALLCSGIDDAIEGSSDFFVQIKLYYERIGSSQLVCLRKIDWIITNVNSGKTVTSKTFDVEKDYLTNDDLIRLSGKLSADIYKSLKA